VRVTTTIRFACPPEQVFDTLADLRNETQWNSRVSSAQLQSAGPIELGSQFEIVNGGTPYEVTITTYERPSRLVLEASGNPDLTIVYTFAPGGWGNADGFRLRLPSERSPQGAVRAPRAGDPSRRAQAASLAESALRALRPKPASAAARRLP
jgi:hypothetical protein